MGIVQIEYKALRSNRERISVRIIQPKLEMDTL